MRYYAIAKVLSAPRITRNVIRYQRRWKAANDAIMLSGKTGCLEYFNFLTKVCHRARWLVQL